ncbi:hypothetical protein M8818_006326 [Zalaria obscura]|uniref:Uncharacterized protein n=1 Tax=Zalaria obscura TaxID=2024903 RepID=A0ACC3S6J5_9PEZI
MFVTRDDGVPRKDPGKLKVRALFHNNDSVATRKAICQTLSSVISGKRSAYNYNVSGYPKDDFDDFECNDDSVQHRFSMVDSAGSTGAPPSIKTDSVCGHPSTFGRAPIADPSLGRAYAGHRICLPSGVRNNDSQFHISFLYYM